MRRINNMSKAHGSVTRSALNLFYDDLTMLIRDNNLSASQIWNMDETGIDRAGGREKVAGPATAKTAPGVVDATKEHFTLVTTVCADGRRLPPYFIFKGKEGSLNKRTLLADCPEDWMWSNTCTLQLCYYCAQIF